MSALRVELERLPHLLSAHILLTVIALVIGIALCIPIAALALRYRRFRPIVLGAASVIQTVPSLAILALMVAVFGVFDMAAAIPALTAYSLLPILRNTVTGIEDVDRNVIEAARGIGMTSRQILRQVQLPLAAPIIIAGVRTATVWLVGIATLSTPVGADSLGNYIFSGLQTRNTTSVLVGVFSAAALALVLDGLIHAAEVATRRRSRGLGVAVLASLVVIVVIGVAPRVFRGTSSGASSQLVIGAKTFTEQFVLAEHLRERLEASGVPVRLKQGLGSTVAFDALTIGEIDVYVDYSGTIWANYMDRSDKLTRDEMIAQISEWLEESHGVGCLGSLGFENTYALAMRRDRAEELGIHSIADLARHAPGMTIAGDYEFFARPEWESVASAYALRFDREQSMDATLMYAAVRDGAVDVISAFSTDGRIAAFDLVVLTDPEQALPPYDALILVSPRAARNDRAMGALRSLIGSIDAAEMRRANMIVDVDGGSIAKAAESLR
ncbi:MAG: ABC transporter permease/substrate-binding protein [Phycisphaerales bacterium]|nr:ABC transporter permease/substrate-binding protein [Phycisphaerales bacterium]